MSKYDISQAEALLRRYDHAMDLHTRNCSRDPTRWHHPDADEFTTLRAFLTPHAESGETRCQYALAMIYWLGLCCETEEGYYREYETAIQIATHWWIAAASRGHWVALDNLITCGVGVEAERVRGVCDQLKQQRQDLVDWSQGMPVYGADFMQELCRTVFGRVITDLS